MTGIPAPGSPHLPHGLTACGAHRRTRPLARRLAFSASVATTRQVRGTSPRGPRPRRRWRLVAVLPSDDVGHAHRLLGAPLRRCGERPTAPRRALLAVCPRWLPALRRRERFRCLSWLCGSARRRPWRSPPGGDVLLVTRRRAGARPLALVSDVSFHLLAFGFYGREGGVGRSARDPPVACISPGLRSWFCLPPFMALIHQRPGAWRGSPTPRRSHAAHSVAEPSISIRARGPDLGRRPLLAATLSAGRMAVARVTLTGAADRVPQQPTRFTC